jgi:hypothetical protein
MAFGERFVHENSPEIAFYEKSFGDLLFFGSLGNGDLSAIHIDASALPSSLVGRWDHEDGEYRGSSPTLQDYFDK